MKSRKTMIRGHNRSIGESLTRAPVCTLFTEFRPFSLLNRHHYRHQPSCPRGCRTSSRTSGGNEGATPAQHPLSRKVSFTGSVANATTDRTSALLHAAWARPFEEGTWRENGQPLEAGRTRCSFGQIEEAPSPVMRTDARAARQHSSTMSSSQGGGAMPPWAWGLTSDGAGHRREQQSTRRWRTIAWTEGGGAG
jgi:hypothetical protein